MKLYRFLLLLSFFSCKPIVHAQIHEVEFVVIDESSGQPIAQVNVFIGNSSFGTSSNAWGECKLLMPFSISGDLILSHIAYELLIVPNSKISELSKQDTLFLVPTGIDLSTIIIEGKRDRKWKSHFRKFKQEFLGTDPMSQKCEIENPEVLRFSEEDGIFSTTAIDLIRIKNNFLAYEIDFLLEEFTISQNGSTKYRGHAKFTDISTESNEKKIKDRREKLYLSTRRHFFTYLIDHGLGGETYEVERVKYHSGGFHNAGVLSYEELIHWDSLNHIYVLTFSDYLAVTNYKVKELVKSKVAISMGGLESQRFSNTQSAGANSSIEYAKSQLYKVGTSIYLDQNGHVLNSDDIQEFGNWAKQRMSNALPSDYGVTDTISFLKPRLPTKSKLIPDTILFKSLIYGEEVTRKKAFEALKSNWKNEYFALLLDIVRLSSDLELVRAILEYMRFKSDNEISDYYSGLSWLWKQDFEISKEYLNLKAEIYKHIDPKFATYFLDRQESSQINPTEIVWGGVKQDEIPPLRYPEMRNAIEDHTISPDDIIFGVEIEGHFRAYPQSILAWHELLIDSIGDKQMALVYCPLCGIAVAYDMQVGMTTHQLGTSGFLYRSNKLMYDQWTQSLWSTIEGKPVLGPLVSENIQLNNYPIVTITWKEWLSQHPTTKVLSRNTGHVRNYQQGEAYKSYFSSDDLMFPVPISNDVLNNKEVVFVVKIAGLKKDPIAITREYLKKNPIVNIEIDGQAIVIITDKKGESRAYESQGVIFKKFKKGNLKDQHGVLWESTEKQLISSGRKTMSRLSSYEIFWFAWMNTYPESRLLR